MSIEKSLFLEKGVVDRMVGGHFVAGGHLTENTFFGLQFLALFGYLFEFSFHSLLFWVEVDLALNAFEGLLVLPFLLLELEGDL